MYRDPPLISVRIGERHPGGAQPSKVDPRRRGVVGRVLHAIWRRASTGGLTALTPSTYPGPDREASANVRTSRRET
jgi:hypothetical protein